ncbi:MAG: hypothetical protein B1H08_03490 [Candidatus Omnitrophica bacterium 4484_171]|nr:MAG: hypothetical protein B1H08_03490 [Candidatus Omnitrophica bacterium 4484_171]
MKIKRSAQSTIEYVLLVAALVLAFIYAANSVIKPKTESMADTGGNIIDKASNEIGSKMGIQ